MKKIFAAVAVASMLFSCNNKTDKGKFTLSGVLKGSPDQKIYLEQLYFSDKPADVLDTADIKNGKFEVSAIAPKKASTASAQKIVPAFFLLMTEAASPFRGFTLFL